jgi:Domain of unknown function (DUF4389)
VPYPVTFEVDYIEERNRLTALIRLILAIPLIIIAYVYAFVAEIAVIVAWFVIVFTGRLPRGLYDFLAGFIRTLTRYTAYMFLLVDQYPPLGPDDAVSYPVRMQFQQLDHYSRLKTGFRFILVIPIVILRYVITLLLEIGAVAAWFVIVITGRLPRGLYDPMVLAQSYIARSDAYIFLLTETYPSFQDEQTRAAGVASSTI